MSEEEVKSLIERIKRKRDTVSIGFRVPYLIKLKYDALDKSEKRLIKETLIRLIDQSFDKLVVEERPVANINININYNKVEARAENRVDVHIDLGEAMALLRDIKQMVYNWYMHGGIPRAAYKNMYGKLKRLERILNRQN